MKKIIFILVMSLVFFTGCSKKAAPSEPMVPEKKPEQTESMENPKKEELQENKKNKEQLLYDAYEGRLSGLSITFKDSLETVRNQLGQPDEISSWQGSDLYVYDNIGIYIDPFDEIVTGLSAGIGYETYGVKIGMTTEAVKSILGEPDYEGISNESGVDTLEYEAGNYLIEFVYDPQSMQTIGLTLYNIEQ